MDFDKLNKVLGVDPSQQLSPLDLIKAAGRGVDSVAAAPTRAAAMAMQNGGGLSGMADAFKNQFGEDPDKAPTPKALLGNDPNTAPYQDNALLQAGVGTMLDPTLAINAFGRLKALKTLGQAGRVGEEAGATANAFKQAGQVAEQDVPALTHSMDLAAQGRNAAKDALYRNELNPSVYKYQQGIDSPEVHQQTFSGIKRQMAERNLAEDTMDPEQFAKYRESLLGRGIDNAPKLSAGSTEKTLPSMDEITDAIKKYGAAQ